MSKIKSEDYFRFNAPFRQWLYDSKGTQLADYKTVDAKELFAKEFVPLWNNNQLDQEFYFKGANYKTDFSRKSKTKTRDDFGFDKKEEERLFTHKPENRSSESRYSSKTDRIQDKSSDKLYLKRRAEDLEELVPKKEGHAKLVEQRRLKSAHTRHEKSVDYELSDDQLLSGSTATRSHKNSTDDYRTLLRLEKERQLRKEREIQDRKQIKQQELQGKIEKYNQREQEVQEMLKKMIRK